MLWGVARGKSLFFFLLTLLHFRLFERGRIQGLKTVRNYKIGPLLAELGSYYCELDGVVWIGRAIGNPQSEARIGDCYFGRIPAYDWFPFTHR